MPTPTNSNKNKNSFNSATNPTTNSNDRSIDTMGASSSSEGKDFESMSASDRSRGTAAGAGLPGSVNEALRMLDQALSRDGANLKELVSTEYSSLRRAIDEMAPKMGEAFRQYGNQAADVIQNYSGQGLEYGKKVASQVDTRVRANPWPVIGGVALGSLAIGFFIGRGGQESTEQFH